MSGGCRGWEIREVTLAGKSESSVSLGVTQGARQVLQRVFIACRLPRGRGGVTATSPPQDSTMTDGLWAGRTREHSEPGGPGLPRPWPGLQVALADHCLGGSGYGRQGAPGHTLHRPA